MAPLATTTAVIKSKQDEIEFAPFGSEDKIKLSLAIIKNYIAEPGKGGELPDDRQSMRFMMLCRSRRLNPFEGDAFMIPFWSSQKNAYEWSLITAHSAFLKRAEVHPEYNGKKSGIIIKPSIQCLPCEGTGKLVRPDKLEQAVCPRCAGRGELDELEGDFVPETLYGEPVTLLGGWCRVFYKSKTNPEYQRLRLSTYAKKNSQWANDPAGMICKCAEAAALRSAFPTTLGGLYLQEETAIRLDPDSDMRKPQFASPQPEMQQTTVTSEPVKVEKVVEPEQPADSPIKGIRASLKREKITEPVLIKFLVETGCCDDGVQTLEELSLNAPEIITMVQEQFADMAARIKALPK